MCQNFFTVSLRFFKIFLLNCLNNFTGNVPLLFGGLMRETVFNTRYNELWLVSEGNVIHVFDNKLESVCFSRLLEKFKNSKTKIHHRYKDGSLHELDCFPDEKIIDNIIETFGKDYLLSRNE